MAVTFSRATKKQARLRMAIDGPSGAGKTYTALVAAFALAETGKVAVIDTEHGSASKYADIFPPFDVLELSTFSPQQYIEGITAAETGGYEVVIIDSLSHAWEGVGGVLEMHDQATKRSASGNSFTTWKDITPLHRKLVEAMLQSPCHVIATMRSKMEYIQTEDDKGRKIIKKVGLAPIQRQGMEYEMDIVADMDIEHNMVISKTRCHLIADQVVSKPTAAWFTTLRRWLTDGAPVPPPTPKPPSPQAPEQKQQATTTTQATTQQPAEQAKPPARPFTAEQLREMFTKLIPTRKTDAVKDGYKGWIAAWLALCFAGMDAKVVEQNRHSLVRYLTGKASLNDCTPQELRAFNYWLKPVADSGGAYKVDPRAEQEAQRVITQVMRDAGQRQLPMDDEPEAEEMTGEQLVEYFGGDKPGEVGK